MEYVVAPQIPGLTLAARRWSKWSRTYQVGCRKAGLGESLQEVRVRAGALHDVRRLLPSRVAYRVDELVEVQWTQRRIWELIDDGIGFELSLPQSGQPSVLAVFALDFRRYVIGVTLSDGSTEIARDLEVLIDDGAPTITCVSPTFGEQIVFSEGDRVPSRLVSDDLEIAGVFVDNQAVNVGSDGRFTIDVPAEFGPNAIKITAEDAIGERTSRLWDLPRRPPI